MATINPFETPQIRPTFKTMDLEQTMDLMGELRQKVETSSADSSQPTDPRLPGWQRQLNELTQHKLDLTGTPTGDAATIDVPGDFVDPWKEDDKDEDDDDAD